MSAFGGKADIAAKRSRAIRSEGSWRRYSRQSATVSAV